MKIKNLFKKKWSAGVMASIVYTLASLFSRGLAIITTPIFTRIMPPDQIGVVSLYQSWASIIGTFGTLALTSGGFQLSLREFGKERNRYVSSVLSLTTLVALLLMVVYAAAPGFWNEVTGLPTALMILLLLQMLLSPAQDFWLLRQRYEYKYKIAGLVTFLSALVASIVAIGAVVKAAENGVQSLGAVRLFATYGVSLTLSLVLWIYIFWKGRTLYSGRYWRFSLSLSLPLIGNSIASQILDASDRAMISKMVGNSAVGIYSTLYTVSSLSLIVWAAINSSFIPYLYENIDKPEKRDQLRTASSGILALFSVIAFLATMLAPEIVQILATKQYYEAIYIMPPIAAGVFFTAVSNMYSNVLIYYRKTQFIMISSGVAAVLNVVLNYIGIQQFGYIAAAYTTMISYMVMGISQMVVATKVYNNTAQSTGKFVYNTKLVGGILLLTAVCCLSCLLLYRTTLLRYVILAVIVVVLLIKRDAVIRLFRR
ncbi:lipopolysaccharide biosynthesis protein [Subdoligranulum variabile]|uniref:Polysaccharide biosynthesis protein n=1 Tax=Subdoligranulum variabile DSM 15176 TaxID=411471 RepID=D1PQ61_9FIRM|nr:oligosaccharide flippase family protein [Subdoligranulum variabile]EFB75171.1 polysaccharide biosynthesis protein [Subdoligranulum variabile DSM 15176]UWP66946.1 oligosaccharide flippase family protein [Subdoligranulum variabile]